MADLSMNELEQAVLDYAQRKKYCLENVDLQEHTFEFAFQHLRVCSFKISDKCNDSHAKIEVWKLGKQMERVEIDSMQTMTDMLPKIVQHVECKTQDYSMFSIHEKLDYIISRLHESPA